MSGPQGIVVVGAGRLGGAVARGLRGRSKGEPMVLVQRPGPKAERLREDGFEVVDRVPPGLAAQAIFVAVKPRDLGAVLDDLGARAVGRAPVISLASGMTLAELRRRLPAHLTPFRARANIFVARNRGTVLLADEAAPSPTQTAVEELLGRLGQLHRVGEAHMVELTWYSSSVPIVVVSELLRRSLADANPELGDLPVRVVLDGLESLSEALRERAGAGFDRATLDLGALVAEVATPGGMNDSALGRLAALGAWDALAQAHATYLSRETETLSDEPTR